MIPVYNPNPDHLRECLRSVLEQAPEPPEMQIEVVDDHSPAGTVEQLVKDLGAGRVGYFQQSANRGLAGNWNTCIERAAGQWVHILHQDDKLFAGYYRQLRRGSEIRPDIGAAFSRYLFIDGQGHWRTLGRLEQNEAGVLEQWANKIAYRQRIQTAAIVVKRDVYERIGGFRTDLCYALDWEMWRRIAAHYAVWYEPQVMACYRVHSQAATANLTATAANVDDELKSILIAETYLSGRVAAEVQDQARRHIALAAIRNAREFSGLGQRAGMKAQLAAALRCDHAGIVWVEAAKVRLWDWLRTWSRPWRKHSPRSATSSPSLAPPLGSGRHTGP